MKCSRPPRFWSFGTMFAAVCGVLWLLVPSHAEAELYKYRTPDGETVVTSEPRSDLELIEIIGGSSSATPKVKKASRSAHKPRKRKQVSKDQNAYDHIVREASEAYGVPFEFIKAVIKIESNYNRFAVSRVGAMGLMQLMPGTAEDMGVSDAFDARQNIFGGTKYLKKMIDRYNGDINLVLAAYNAGPGNVDKYSGIPFEQTRGYVKNVYTWYQRYLEAAAPADDGLDDVELDEP